MRFFLSVALSTALYLLVQPTTVFAAALKLGEKPPLATIAGEDGGRVDGSGPWTSDLLTPGKVWSVFYVDPDEREVNRKMEEALKEANFPQDKYSSSGIINMDATWLPNSIISKMLVSTQKDFPEVLYAKDMKKVLVKQWGLKDDGYNVLVFDKNGLLVYQKDGALSSGDIRQLLSTIKKAME